MKFNITMKDAKFFVNEEKRIVVCVIEHTNDLLIKFINNNCKLGSDCDGIFWEKYNHCLSKKLVMPNKFIGTAYCSEDDEWDENIGRVIAFSRAKDNLLQSFFKHTQTYVTYINKCLDESITIFNNLGEKLTQNKKHRHEYIINLVGSSEDGNTTNS